VKLRFTKMHGAGNDFVVVDCRYQPLDLDANHVAKIGDRHFGVGFDQLLMVEPSRDPSCAFRYAIYNSDGSTALQCGNGVRCVAAWLQRAGALGVGAAKLESPSGPIGIETFADGRVRAEMGVPQFAPAAIPFTATHESDSYRLNITGSEIEFGAVAMGNPHAVIEVADVAAAPLESVGAALSTSLHFPQGCNVGFVEIVNRAHVRLRVWERGAGATLACGSGACAAVAVLRRRGKLDAEVRGALPGGELEIHWDGAGCPLWMTGPAQFVFEGEMEL